MSIQWQMVRTKPVRIVQLKNNSHHLSSVRRLSEPRKKQETVCWVKWIKVILFGRLLSMDSSGLAPAVQTFQATEPKRLSVHCVPSTRLASSIKVAVCIGRLATPVEDHVFPRDPLMLLWNVPWKRRFLIHLRSFWTRNECRARYKMSQIHVRIRTLQNHI